MTFDDVRAIALAWPEVQDGTSWGAPALKVLVGAGLESRGEDV